jgi:hypothetical protein
MKFSVENPKQTDGRTGIQTSLYHDTSNLNTEVKKTPEIQIYR